MKNYGSIVPSNNSFGAYDDKDMYVEMVGVSLTSENFHFSKQGE